MPIYLFVNKYLIPVAWYNYESNFSLKKIIGTKGNTENWLLSLDIVVGESRDTFFIVI